VNKLKETFNCEIVCSKDCAERIVDRKKNMSIFYNQIGFQTYPADIIIEKINNKLVNKNIYFQFIESMGHTNSSVCFLVDGNLFTGDTIIKNLKTVIKLPGGNKEKLKNSLNLIFRKFGDKHIKVFPGHGNCFFMKEININELI
jgi:glyoxylase-like metal-dependent hydrolase (beta-lactamase superfamily II)